MCQNYVVTRSGEKLGECGEVASGTKYCRIGEEGWNVTLERYKKKVLELCSFRG